MNNQIKTLGDALPEEIQRCEELLKQYEALGPNGRFGYYMIKRDVDFAKRAIAESDTVAMIRAHELLKECK